MHVVTSSTRCKNDVNYFFFKFDLFIYYLMMNIIFMTIIVSRFHYSDTFNSSDTEVRRGLYTVIERMVPENDVRNVIDKFDRAEGLFGVSMAVNA